MVLKNFQKCSQAHKDKFQYCCIRSRKIFCQSCFHKLHYPCQHASSRCGNIIKLTHKGIAMVQEFRGKLYTKQLTSNYEKYKQFDRRILKIINGYEHMKDWVQQKLPLFLHKMINLLLENLHTDIYKKKRLNSDENFSKLDSLNFELAQLLNKKKNEEQPDKQLLIAKCVTGLLNVEHELEGLQFKLKRQFQKNSPEEAQKPLNKFLEDIENKHLSEVFSKLKENWKKNMEAAMGDLIKAVNKGLQFPLIKFLSGSKSYASSQKYPIENIRTQVFSQYQQYATQIYKGYHINIQWLQKCPQQLLHVSKSFIKQKLQSIYSKTNEPKKSKFPYKFAYPISTTLQNDEDVESLTLQLEKDYIKSFIKDGTSPYYNTTKIGIMGKQFILINFYKKKSNDKKNQPLLTYQMKIFNYDHKRNKYYQNVREILQLNALTKNKEDQKIVLDEQLSQTQLAYMNFQLAFKCLLNDESQINQQGSTIANRGSDMFKRVIEIWKAAAEVHLEVSRNIQQIKMIVL